MPEGNPARPEGREGKTMLQRMNRSHAALRAFGLPFAEWYPGMKILDAGCGGGAAIADMLDLSEDSHIFGIDHMQESIDVASETNRKYLGKRVSLSLGDVSKLPYGDESFDLVTAVETIYFWPDILKAFREICRVLVPEGQFLILCEGSDPENNPWPKMEGMTIYSGSMICSLMEQAGFSSCVVHHGEGENICAIGRKSVNKGRRAK